MKTILRSNDMKVYVCPECKGTRWKILQKRVKYKENVDLLVLTNLR